MKRFLVKCDQCKEIIYRSRGRINESKKFGWKTYCSFKCQYNAKNKQQVVKCSNPKCTSIFKRQASDIKKSKNVYCSRSCAASVNNYKFPKRPALRKMCKFCKKQFISREKYCSVECKNKDQIITKEEVIKRIKDFYIKTGRIPLKREFKHARVGRERYGTWNNTIIAAGFSPNPVKFAKKYLAKDGHKCDSLAEKIIDDWLYSRQINHERSLPYPGNLNLHADFVIKDYWIEFFGLHGQHKRYDELRKEKLKLVKAYNLKLIDIYPKDLFPKNRLEKILSVL